MLLGFFPIGQVPLGFLPPLPLRPQLQIPNGRWRAVPDTSYVHFVNAVTDLSPEFGEFGFSLFFNTPQAQLDPSVSLVFVKPSGALLSIPEFFLTFGADIVAGYEVIQGTYVEYTFRRSDLNELGTWFVFLERDGIAISGRGSFTVI